MSAVDWSGYRKCPVCHAPMGSACTRLTGTIVDGRVHHAAEVEADSPHRLRKPRTASRG